jgi:hypothetical protein
MLLLGPTGPVPLPVPPTVGVGFGATATGGGPGGEIYHVTTLADSGPGSLREAVGKSGRIVVFDLGGTIALKSELHIAGSVTLDGATAPSPGITIGGQPVSFSGSRNDIVRYVRLRQGAQSGKHKSSLMISKGAEMLFDHVSIEWGRWDGIDVNDSRSITFQNCLIGEEIGPQRFGCLCGSDSITFYRCLFVDNQSRNPKAKGHGVQFVNNVVYNWGVTGFVGGHSAAVHDADLVGNYFIKGPNSSEHFVGEFTATDQIYQRDNRVDRDRDGQLNGRPVVAADFPGATLVAVPSTMLSMSIESPEQAFARVIADAGDTAPRDPTDARLIAQVTSLGRDGAIVEAPPAVAAPTDVAKPTEKK